MIVAVFATATIAYSVKLGDNLRYPDESEYLRLANNLATTGHYSLDGTTPTAYRPPAYPLLLATGMMLGVPITALRVANASTLLACMALLYLLLRKHNAAHAKLAALLIMTYPVLMYTASTFYPQIPATAILLSALVLLFSSPVPPGNRRCIIAGILLGLTILMVPTFGFTLVFTAVFIAAQSYNRENLRNAMLILCGAGIAIAPWVSRNALVFNRFIPLSTNNGINLLLGNSENTTPNSGTTTDISRYDQVARLLPEIQANDYYCQAAITYIKDHPFQALKLYAGKLANYFNYQNHLFVQSERSWIRTLSMLFSYSLLLVLALFRLAMAYHYPLLSIEKYIACLYFLHAPVSAIFFTRIRFRLPMDILLIVLAASSVIIIANYLRSRDVNTNQMNRGMPIK